MRCYKRVYRIYKLNLLSWILAIKSITSLYIWSMKKVSLFILLVSIILTEANSQTNTNIYGDKFSSLDAKEFTFNKSEFPENMDMPIKIKGEILSTCPKKGCWVKVDVNSEEVFVTFKNYSFFVPKQGIQGKNIIINGDIKIDTISIPQLKHYAYDAGKSEDIISKITEPKITKSIEATGVAIID